MTLRSRPLAGLTLIELLVSISLITLLVTAAITAFTQIRALTRRIEMRQQLHNSARTIFERLNWELSSLMHGSAVFAIGYPQVSTTDYTTTPPQPKLISGPVELVFLRGKYDNQDFGISSTPDVTTDLVWSRWYWDSTNQTILVSSSSPWRSFRQGYSYNVYPTPERVITPAVGTAAAKLAATLNQDALVTGSNRDVGDYQDLINNQAIIASNCSDFSMEVVCQDGTVNAVTSATPNETSCISDGQRVDGWGGLGNALAKRPRLIRIRFTLTEPATPINGAMPDNLVLESFSFTFLVPGLSPG